MITVVTPVDGVHFGDRHRIGNQWWRDVTIAGSAGTIKHEWHGDSWQAISYPGEPAPTDGDEIDYGCEIEPDPDATVEKRP